MSAPRGSGPGGCLLLGVSTPGDVCSGGLLGGGVSAPGRVCSRGMAVCSWGVSAPRGVSALAGLLPGGVVSKHALRQIPPPPVDRQTPVKT